MREVREMKDSAEAVASGQLCCPSMDDPDAGGAGLGQLPTGRPWIVRYRSLYISRHAPGHRRR